MFYTFCNMRASVNPQLQCKGDWRLFATVVKFAAILSWNFDVRILRQFQFTILVSREIYMKLKYAWNSLTYFHLKIPVSLIFYRPNFNSTSMSQWKLNNCQKLEEMLNGKKKKKTKNKEKKEHSTNFALLPSSVISSCRSAFSSQLPGWNITTRNVYNLMAGVPHSLSFHSMWLVRSRVICEELSLHLGGSSPSQFLGSSSIWPTSHSLRWLFVI